MYGLPPTMKVIDQHVATLFLNVCDEIMMIMNIKSKFILCGTLLNVGKINDFICGIPLKPLTQIFT